MNVSDSHKINRGISHAVPGDCSEDDLKMMKVIQAPLQARRSSEGSLHSFFQECKIGNKKTAASLASRNTFMLFSDTDAAGGDDCTELTPSCDETEYSDSLNAPSWHSHSSSRSGSGSGSTTGASPSFSSGYGGGGKKQPLTRGVAVHTVRENVEDVDVTSLQPRCLLGEGFFGKVWLVTDHENRKFALKKLSKFELLCEDQVHAVHREKQILLQLHHPGIVQLHAAYQDASHLYLLQPFLPGGDLFSLWQGAPNAQLPEAQVQFYAACLIDALWYMHSSQKIVYRDLKPENIVIDGAGYPVLVDFGHAKRLEPSQHDSGGDYQTFTLCGTAKYLSPEVVQGSGHSFAADYWSLGVVVYELLSGENPFEFWPGMDELALYGSIARADYLALPEGLVQPAEQQQQPALADLMDGLLTKDPARRLGALETVARNEVLEHEWLQGMDVWALRRRAVPAPWVPTAAGDSVDNSASYSNNVDHNPRLTQQQPHQQQQHDGETDDKDDSLASENNPPLTAKEQALFADFDSC